MTTLMSYQSIIEQVLSALTQIPYAYGDLQTETVFDPSANRYLGLTVNSPRNVSSTVKQMTTEQTGY
ncbi:MAG: XisI protein [Chloroflexi bacterium]|nr:XisI protein [Chloroflexota bacterium]